MNDISLKDALQIVQLLIPAISQAVDNGSTIITLEDVQASADALDLDIGVLERLIASKTLPG